MSESGKVATGRPRVPAAPCETCDFVGDVAYAL